MKAYSLVTIPDRDVFDGKTFARIAGRQMIVEGEESNQVTYADSWIEAKRALGFDLTPWQTEMLGRMAA